MKGLRRGSVLMEYALLLLGMAALVEGVALATYDFQGWGSFGPAAKPLVYLFQRIVAVISLPVP